MDKTGCLDKHVLSAAAWLTRVPVGPDCRLYDAGDHVKLGFTFAHSAGVLAWGLLEYREGFIATGEYDQGTR